MLGYTNEQAKASSCLFYSLKAATTNHHWDYLAHYRESTKI